MAHKLTVSSAWDDSNFTYQRHGSQPLPRRSDHACQRMAQRGQSTEKITFAFLHGTIYKVGEREVYFLRRKDIDDWDIHDREGNEQVMRLAGLTLITTPNGGEIITIYQNHAKRNKFKSKWGHSQQPSRKPR